MLNYTYYGSLIFPYALAHADHIVIGQSIVIIHFPIYIGRKTVAGASFLGSLART
ncbi:hypothetical protein MPTA5024_20445 [Microbispora sp. ATCC PTA-5024]|nr:hypothetical protein MPTA5024_20445 [Microbispora sp. ATCC PTA-5024]